MDQATKANIDQKINQFKQKITQNRFNLYSLNLDSYQNVDYFPDEKEVFLIFKRALNYSPNRTNNSDQSDSSNIDLTQTSSDLLFPFSSPEARKLLKKIFLSHYYDQLPITFNVDYFQAQVECYMKNQNDNLAHLQGFGVYNTEGYSSLVAVTERPINGQLISLFSKLAPTPIEKVKDDQNELKIYRSDSFQSTEIKTISQEDKLLMIIGIIHGIAFIHKNGFIHSNLSPKTVYLNGKLQSIICDYCFIPLFQVEGPFNDSKKYKFSIEKNEVHKIFKNSIYTAPEIFERGVFESSADIYSLGLTIFFILAEKEANFLNGKIQNFENLSVEWRNFIEKCTDRDPLKRPTAIDLLDELLNKCDIQKFVSSIPAITVFTEISKNTKLSLEIIKKDVFENDLNSEILAINIFQKMIPNINEISEDIKLVIASAEKGVTESIEKVGDLFSTGEENFFQDYTFAHDCYKEAEERGSTKSAIKLAEFKENGKGCSIDFEDAIELYDKAIELIQSKNNSASEISSENDSKIASENDSKISSENDSKISSENDSKISSENDSKISSENDPTVFSEKEIVSKRDKLIEKMHNSILLKKVQKNYTETEIRNFFGDLKIDIIGYEKESKHQNVAIHFQNSNDKQKAKTIIKNKSKYKVEKFSYLEIKSERLKSLSRKLDLIDFSKYYQGEGNKTYQKLGEGKFAEVYLVYEKGTEKPFAKKCNIKPLYDSQVNSFKREIIMASELNHHPAILKYIGFNDVSNTINEIYPAILVEYIKGKDLFKAIEKDSDKLTDTVKLIIILGIASGLSEMSNHQIIHRDLKPENIMLNEKLEPIICDLGLSRQYSDLEDYRMTENVGSGLYMAPELYNSDFSVKYRSEIDSYSFGMILYQILTLSKSFDLYKTDNPYDILEKKFIDMDLQLPDDMHDLFKYLIKSCWSLRIDDRPDPPTIYYKLRKAIDNNEILLPNADMNVVNEYLQKLPPANIQ